MRTALAWLARRPREGDDRPINRSGTILALALAVTTIAAAPAAAHRSPDGCTINGLELVISQDRAIVRNGDVINYAIGVANNQVGACDVSGATITVTLPAADGTADGSLVPVTTGASYAAGTFTAQAGNVAYTVALAPGISSAAIRVEATFIVHGEPHSTSHLFPTVTTPASQPVMTLSVAPTPSIGAVPLNVTYNYVLSNFSSTTVPIASPTISPSLCSPVVRGTGDTDGDNLLDNGEAWRYSCLRTFTSAGIFSGGATATGTSTVDTRTVLAGPANAMVEATRPVTLPHLTLTKSAAPLSGPAPLGVTYTYTVLNDSATDAPISDVTIADTGCAPITRSDGDTLLAVGETWTFTCSTTITTPGEYFSSAIATGKNTIDGLAVYSAASGATVTASFPTAATPAPTPDPDAGTPTTTPDRVTRRTPSTRVVIPLSARFTGPRSGCRGRSATVTLKVGTTVLARKRLKLSRSCRYSVRFDILRSRLRNATRVTISTRLGKQTDTLRLPVPG